MVVNSAITPIVQQMRRTALAFMAAGGTYKEYLKCASVAMLVEVLEKEGGNKSRAAKTLGKHRNTLDRQMKILGVKAR